MSAWNDFNDAQSASNIIPKGTVAKVRMTIRPGGFDDPAQGWTDGLATRGGTGSVYLDAEFTVLEGPYAKRKLWTRIGLFSSKGPEWGNMGRAFVRSVLNSVHGLSDKDTSPAAQEKRRIGGLRDLDGMEFAAKIEEGTGTDGSPKNEIRMAVTPDHRDYAAVMGLGAGQVSQPAASPQPNAYAAARQQPAPAQGSGNRPSWAM